MTQASIYTTADVSAKPRTGLSKSRVLSGLQCQRRLWLETYRRDLQVVDDRQQQVFDAGNDLGELARGLLGPGHTAKKKVAHFSVKIPAHYSAQINTQKLVRTWETG